MIATYSPAVFDISTVAQAKQIILTPEGRSTDERWETETPYFLDLIAELEIRPGMTVLDYGCGIGRLAKGMIEQFGCRVVGADISQNMRTLANDYVKSDRFMACHPTMLDGLKFDAAIAVWVLQHCFRPKDDIARIKSSLHPGSPFLVINNNGRAVPTTQGTWVDDGVSIASLVGSQFRLIEDGRLDQAFVGGPLNKFAAWARYENS